jgi:hypothetical protein
MVLIFSQIKGKLLGDPDRSLSEAYQIAVTINSLENDYANQFSTKKKGSRTDQSSYILENIDSHVAILQNKISEFHAANVNSDRLSYDYAEKLIFIEGILAKYKLNNNSFSSSTVDVRSTPMRSTILPQIPRRNSTQPQANEPENAPTFSGKPKILPRSIGRTVDKLKKDFSPQAEKQVIKDFRRSRSKTFIAAKVLVLLIIIPLLAQLISKTLIVLPIVEHNRAESQSEIFLHAEMKEEALKEIHLFKEELELESMLSHAPHLTPETEEKKVKEKVAEIEEEYRHKSNSAISNVFADIFGLIAFALVVFFQRKEIQTLKSFIDNMVYGLSDGAKAFGIILLTDIFVGFHSPHGWEVLLESISSHLGVAANHSAISIFIATVPVVLATIFKYWIFRSLSRMSPSTVATLKDMND